ncbi:Lrp/AsnC family transcriptional regulator [Granulosicoccus antarcticus]|uniref:Leucine-responsive regulatory protein n=1 Tax=Granulosicoccus antarcticus IMCC3135 TaxID=1192854 RepID=A0A2Z2NWH8_9GAMM|nr:Lrp/AsnC family transcriptional regulator [Granulosicoccus antarcticus]ASJ72067.1 Leucine-responsive regulatory protein [Granulosicoccus antarcticus IMCC3135]
MESETNENSIDDIDRQLLSIVQKNALISTENMAMQVGLTATSAKRRLNKLRRNGTISKDVSIVDPKKLGYEIFTLVSVNLERDQQDIMQSFRMEIKNNPRIMQGFYTTGDADFILLVASKTLSDYEAFTQTYFWNNHNIKSFKTMVVMDCVKIGFELPMI